MSDMLSNAVSGLLAFQQALDTTSNNIANASTPGYSRETPVLATQPSTGYGNGWTGNGVQVTTIQRLFEQTAAAQLRTATGSYNQLNTFSTLAGQIDSMLGNGSSGVAAQLQSFSNAVQVVGNSPTSAPARQALLSQAQALTSSLQGFDANLQQINSQINSSIDAEATTISSLAQSIAQLNQQIAVASGGSSQAPNDLLDQRDKLITQLASHVSVTTSMQSDGTENVFVGSGQALVSGATVSTLVTTPNPYDPTHTEIALQGASGSVNITAAISGGTLGGLLQFRSQMLDPARNSIGQIAITVADAVNKQNQAGMDLNGNLGQAVFAVGGVQVAPNVGNGGTATVAVTRTDANAITTADYRLNYDGTNWSLQQTDTGASVPMTGAGTVSSPLVADGMSIVLSGTPNAGDSFKIQPTVGAVGGMQVLLANSNSIAAASAVITSAASTNTGNGTIDAGTVFDPTAYAGGNYSIHFPTSNSWEVWNAAGTTVIANGVYGTSQPIVFMGAQVKISGAPAAGDQFLITPNKANSSDNSNANAMAGVFDQLRLSNGTQSINQALGKFIGGVGTQASSASNGAAANQALMKSANATQQSVSGVNLDEEAANLLQFQQAYQAAAQVIKVADTLFQSLIAAVHG